MRRLAFLCTACILCLAFTACGNGSGTPIVPTFPPDGSTTIPTFLPGGTTVVPNFAPTSTSPGAGTTLVPAGTPVVPLSPPTGTVLVGGAGNTPAPATSVPAFVPSASPAGITNNAGAGAVGSSGTTNCTAPTGWVPYVVQSGDTLSTIAQATGATTANLVSGNCLANPDQLQAGQSIYVPSLPASGAAGAAVTTVAITATPVAVVATGVPASSVAGATATSVSAPVCLPQTPVPGAVPATVMTLVVQPGTLLNGTYQVNTSAITLVAQNAQNAAKVRFCLSSSSAIAEIGEVAVVNNQAILQWQIPAGLSRMIIETKAIAPDGSVWDGQSVNVVKSGG